MAFKTVSKSNPCPICGKPDQCSRTEDGFVTCFRILNGKDGYHIQKDNKKDSMGRDYTVYRPIGSWSKIEKPPETNKLWSRIYEHIFKKLPCEPEEKSELSRRDISDFANYGTMTYSNASTRREIAQELLDQFGDEIFTCPGISKNCPSGKGELPWIEGAEGLMIPVRDWQGFIQGIMLRPRINDGKSKYIWMSSANSGGPGAIPSLHVPLKTPKIFRDVLWITEGPLKADILAECHDIPCVGTPNNNTQLAKSLINNMRFDKIILAYDQDSKEIARKNTSRNLLMTFLQFPEHDLMLAVWDGTKAKGIDDLMQKKEPYQLLGREQAIEYLKSYAGPEELFEHPDYTFNPDGLKTEWTEAIELIKAYGKDMKFISDWDDYLMWNGKTWVQDKNGPGYVYKKFLNLRMSIVNDMMNSGELKKDNESLKWLLGGHKMARMNAVIAHLKTEVSIRKQILEIPVVRNVLTCPNGTIDLTTGEIRKHQRDDWQMALCPTVYDPTATCPRWLQLLDDVFLKSEGLINYVQKIFGMSITGAPNDHVFPVFCGEGRNGKTTITNTIQQVLGRDLSGGVSSNHLCKGNESHPTWLASFHGKRLMVAQETARGAELNVALVKQLCGGDMITCRKLFQNEWSFYPTHTLILCTNERPKIFESNQAIWSRISLIPFMASFSAEAGNLETDLPARLLAESQGILTWLVQGALKYRAEGLVKPPEVIQQNNEYREDSDPEQSLTIWLDQFPVSVENLWVNSSELLANYIDFCLHKGLKALSKNPFTTAMSKATRGWERRTSAGYTQFRRKITPAHEVRQMEINDKKPSKT